MSVDQLYGTRGRTTKAELVMDIYSHYSTAAEVCFYQEDSSMVVVGSREGQNRRIDSVCDVLVL